jgi:predicted SprT family Zn-dependent metalloprotease
MIEQAENTSNVETKEKTYSHCCRCRGGDSLDERMNAKRKRRFGTRVSGDREYSCQRRRQNLLFVQVGGGAGEN